MQETIDPPSRQAILDTLAEEGAPLGIEQLIERLQVPDEALVGMRRRVAAMQRDGQILAGRKGALMLVSRIDLIPGRVSGHRDGFGFMLPDDGSPDIFLPPREMAKVMHGDRVLVRRIGADSRGRPEGKIVEITLRNPRPVVGRLVSERGVLMLAPEDQRIKHDILIEPGGAGGAQPGQVVSAVIIEPPGWNKPPIARVTEVLGSMDDAGMEIEIAVRKFDVPHRFPDDVLAEADALPDALRPADYRNRVDLRDVALVTIDGEDARDFDDAVYCEAVTDARGRPKGWRLLVAIADVSHYVRPGSPLDAEAQSRTTSVYFPRRVIPMLPEKLSNGLCSINPEVDRLVLVADMVVDTAGEVIAYQFYPAVMHSAARLTYNEVWGILGGDDVAAIERRSALLPRLHELYALYQALEAARKKRGAIEFDTPETKMLCDAQGRITEIVAQSRNDAHRLIEECMLAANTCAADFLVRNKHPGLYRVHEGPSADRLAKLREFLAGAGLSLGNAAQEAKEKRGPRPQDYQILSQRIHGRPDSALLQTMMLRSMQQAVYTPDNQGHFGLAYDAYAHFTSPIRRYPDLLNHRAIKALLEHRRYQPAITCAGSQAGEEAAADGRTHGAGRARAAGAAASVSSGGAASRGRESVSRGESLAVWESLGQICSANERRADEASRDVQAWLKCVYMRDRIGDHYRGHITGVAPFGLFITLDDLYVEGMAHVSELGTEYFRFDEATQMLMGERTGKCYALTDEVEVEVIAVNLEARRIDFRLLNDGSRRRTGDTRTPDRVGTQSRTPARSDAPSSASGRVASPSRTQARFAGTPPRIAERAASMSSTTPERTTSSRTSGRGAGSRAAPEPEKKPAVKLGRRSAARTATAGRGGASAARAGAGRSGTTAKPPRTSTRKRSS